MDKLKELANLLLQKITTNYKTSIAALIGSSLTLAYLYILTQTNKYHKNLYIIPSSSSSSSSSTPTPSNITVNYIQLEEGDKLKYWLIQTKIHYRNPHRIILYMHCQHTCTYFLQQEDVQDNFMFLKTLAEHTVSDVIAFQYRGAHQKNGLNRTQQSVKKDALAICGKAIQIAKQKGKALYIMGQDMGALLGIYCCTSPPYNTSYTLKALIIKNLLSSITPKPTTHNLLQKILPRVQWQQQQILNQLQNLHKPTMLILSNSNNNDIIRPSEDKTAANVLQMDQVWSGNQYQLLYYSRYKGRKYVYQVEDFGDGGKYGKQKKQGKQGKQKKQGRNGDNQDRVREGKDMKLGKQGSDKTKQNSRSMNSYEEWSESSSISQEQYIRDRANMVLNEVKDWAKDMNLFMEIDIFMNNVNH